MMPSLTSSVSCGACKIDKFQLSANASLQISWHVGGINALERLQPLNASAPMSSRLVGNFIEKRPAQEKKALSSSSRYLQR